MMKDLYQFSAGCPKHLQQFEGGTHNGTWTCYGYYDTINNFLAPILQNASLSSEHTDIKENEHNTNQQFV